MPNSDKQNDFDFIKEQILENRRNHRKELLIAAAKAAVCAIVFGLVSALVFVITEPRIRDYLQEDEEPEKEPISLVSVTPDLPDVSGEDGFVIGDETKQTDIGSSDGINNFIEPDAVVVERSIEANINDYLSIRSQMKKIAMDANKSIVSVCCTKPGVDWFQNPKTNTTNTTGLVVGNNGIELAVLVSYDRIEGASNLSICFSDNCSITASLLDYEEELNLAIITAKLQEIPSMILETIDVAHLGESYTISIGTPVIAVGNPNGYANSMEDGIITSKGSCYYVTDNRIDLFNTNLADYPNGDGVVINLNGEVIGIITRTLKEGENDNLSTVMGISKLLPIIERLANDIPRMYFGVKAEDMTETAKKQNGLEVDGGIYINEVLQDSPAFNAGLKAGDIIVSVNDVLMKSTSSFYSKISEFVPGDVIEIKYVRTSQASKDIRKLKVKLEGKNS